MSESSQASSQQQSVTPIDWVYQVGASFYDATYTALKNAYAATPSAVEALEAAAKYTGEVAATMEKWCR